MAYCDAQFVKTLTDLNSAYISDPKINSLRDEVATPLLNDDLHVSIDHENLEEINDEKENKVDGSNKTFYLSSLHRNDWHLGDKDNDGTVDTGDIDAYYIDGNDARQTITVASIDDTEIGKVTLEQSNGSALPSSVDRDEVFLSYRITPIDVSSPHPLVKLACGQLTAAYAFTRIDVKKLKDFSIGDTTIRKQSDGFSIMMDHYKDTYRKIVDEAVIDTVQNKKSFKGVLSRDE